MSGTLQPGFVAARSGEDALWQARIIEAASPAALPAASTLIIIQTGRGQRHGRQADGRTLPGRGQRLISFFKKRIRFFKKLIFFFKKLISGA